MLKDHIESKTNYKVKVLSLRMRNTYKIGVAAVEEYQLKNGGSFPVACVLEPGKSEHSVPGECPDVVAQIGFNKLNMENIGHICHFYAFAGV